MLHEQGQARVQEFTKGMRDFEKGKTLQKREKRETFYKNYIFKIRPDFNVFLWIFPDFKLTFLTKKGENWAFFLLPQRGSGGCGRLPASPLYPRLLIVSIHLL